MSLFLRLSCKKKIIPIILLGKSSKKNLYTRKKQTFFAKIKKFVE
jgi:hypothetical protein